MSDERGEPGEDPLRGEPTQPVDVQHTEPVPGQHTLVEPPPPQPWDPWAGQRPDAGYLGSDQPWHQPGPAGYGPTPAGPVSGRSGPGWPGVIGVAAVTAVLAGLLGGLAGGWLGANDHLNIARDSSPIPTAGPGATSRPSGSIANIAARSLPSIVTIKVQGADGGGTGSGFVLDNLGHIITNNHVVAGAASSGRIAVQLSNGQHLDASVVGHDASYDIAVIKVNNAALRPLVMGRSADVVVGDEVIAVGAPLGLDSTVTSGIVSALNRPVSPGGGNDQSFINAIQTDAAINPGNSGGPLLDMSGQVIGINSAIARIPGSGSSESGNIGVGFSIPSDQVRKTADQLIRTGKAEHPIIGVLLDQQYTGEGVRILDKAVDGHEPVTKGGPAEKAGLKPGDVILDLDGRPLTDPDEFVVAIRSKNVGDQVTLTVRHGSRTSTVKMTLQGTTGS